MGDVGDVHAELEAAFLAPGHGDGVVEVAGGGAVDGRGQPVPQVLPALPLLLGGILRVVGGGLDDGRGEILRDLQVAKHHQRVDAGSLDRAQNLPHFPLGRLPGAPGLPLQLDDDVVVLRQLRGAEDFDVEAGLRIEGQQPPNRPVADDGPDNGRESASHHLDDRGRRQLSAPLKSSVAMQSQQHGVAVASGAQVAAQHEVPDLARRAAANQGVAAGHRLHHSNRPVAEAQRDPSPVPLHDPALGFQLRQRPLELRALPGGLHIGPQGPQVEALAPGLLEARKNGLAQ